jgi:hypothetical protein
MYMYFIIFPLQHAILARATEKLEAKAHLEVYHLTDERLITAR